MCYSDPLIIPCNWTDIGMFISRYITVLLQKMGLHRARYATCTVSLVPQGRATYTNYLVIRFVVCLQYIHMIVI